MHSERFGSMLKSRALQSATQDSRFASHPEGLSQSAQPPAGCAAANPDDMPAMSARTSTGPFMMLPRFRDPGFWAAAGRVADNHCAGVGTRRSFTDFADHGRT